MSRTKKETDFTVSRIKNKMKPYAPEAPNFSDDDAAGVQSWGRKTIYNGKGERLHQRSHSKAKKKKATRQSLKGTVRQKAKQEIISFFHSEDGE